MEWASYWKRLTAHFAYSNCVDFIGEGRTCTELESHQEIVYFWFLTPQNTRLRCEMAAVVLEITEAKEASLTTTRDGDTTRHERQRQGDLEMACRSKASKVSFHSETLGPAVRRGDVMTRSTDRRLARQSTSRRETQPNGGYEARLKESGEQRQSMQ
jgi:hypothetical protein